MTRHPWITKMRDASGHEHAADGRFGRVAGTHGGKDEEDKVGSSEHGEPSGKKPKKPTEKKPHEIRKVEFEEKHRFPQENWDELKQAATHISKVRPDVLITVFPSPEKEDYFRVGRWDKHGAVGHVDVPEEELKDFLHENAYERGHKRIVIEGGIGGSWPSANYAGVGFRPDVTGAKGVRAFVGPEHGIEWMSNRLASGGYKHRVEDIPEEIPEKSGVQAFDNETPFKSHSILVHEALEAGEHVPDDVLADYPELAEQYAKKRRRKSLSPRATMPHHPWLVKASRFEESKHPRDHGKFSSSQGARGSGKPKTDMRPNADLDDVWNAPSEKPKPAASGDIRHNPALDELMGMEGPFTQRKPAPKPTTDLFADAMSGQDKVKQVHAAAAKIGQQFAFGKAHKVKDFIGALRQHPPEVLMAICQKAGIVKTDKPRDVVQKFYAAFGGKVKVSFPGTPPPLPKRGAQPPPLPKRGGKSQPPPIPLSPVKERLGEYQRPVSVARRRKGWHPWLQRELA